MAERKEAEYLKLKEEEYEAERKRAEEKKNEADKEMERVIQEAKRIIENEARKKFEAEMKFLKSLHDEALQLENSHSINRAFVFSYYDLLSYSNIFENRDSNLNASKKIVN